MRLVMLLSGMELNALMAVHIMIRRYIQNRHLLLLNFGISNEVKYVLYTFIIELW